MRNSKNFWRGLLLLVMIAALCGGMAVPFLTPVQAAPVMQAGTNIVVSQVYGGGGNSGASYINDYIEIFNPTNSTISLSGWSVQYANATGTTWQVTNLSGSLASGQYYLVQEAAGAGGTVNLPTPDAIGNIAMAAAAGKVALVNTTTALIGLGCPFDVSVVDFVGYGTSADCFEGVGSAPAPSNTTADLRSINGCTDTNNNNTDFTAGAPNPRNSTTVNPCSANVIINEVAWAGTQAFAGDEWIELYNAGSAPVDLTNWRIQAADGDPLILLSGNLAPGGYLLLERASQNVTNVPGVVYNSVSLSDTGETLYLLDDTSSILDTANSNGGGWPSGAGAPNFPTMERTGTGADSDLSWVTFAGTPTAVDAGGNSIYGTPGGANWGLNMVPTFTPTASLTATLTFTPSPTNTGTPTNTATPSGFLSLVINEVAWMGTAASTSDEWIELYNPGLVPINLTGWILKGVDGSPLINLTGTIAAGGYFLLERTDNTTISDIVADQVYTGELANTSEILQLFDPGNKLIDSANSNGSSWPAGSSTTFGSMERRGVIADSDTAWITNTGVVKNGLNANGNPINGTPRQPNWAITVTATPSATPTLTKVPTKIKTSTPQPAPPPQLVAINEFVPRPGRDWNNDGAVNTGDEYIEIINFGTVSVNLSGYTLDDEVNVGSNPYSLPSVTLNPGERVVFYGSKTNLLLSDGGDGVRLLKPNGQLADAFNYTVVNYPDQSFCRLPDNGGLDDWSRNCFPTPGLGNNLGGNLPNSVGGEDEPACPIADTLPLEFFLAECDPFGHNIWSRPYWDDTGWYGEKTLPYSPDRWEIFVD